MNLEQISQMQITAGKAIISGFKQAGINFVAALACSGFGHLLLELEADPAFEYVHVANENDAIAICAGASLAGKKPVFVAQNSGLILATYALLDSIHWFGGFPMLMVIDHRGTFGDSAGYIYTGYAIQQNQILDNLHILYHTISLADIDQIPTQIVRAQKTAEANGGPAALLLSREVI